MKTLLLFILLFIFQILSFNPESFIGEPAIKFEEYCYEIGSKPKYGFLNNKGYIRSDKDNKIIICIYEREIEAFKIYYSNEHYDINEVERVFKTDYFMIKPGYYISINNPDIISLHTPQCY